LRYFQAITEFFPKGIRITRPQGGFVLWIEMKNVDGYKLHKRALRHQIGIAPGQIFSSQGQFQNYFRLSYGLPWSDKVEKGLKTLGELMRK
jgi:DNA-binding transcriptional MocR family regulator